jgi:Mrp family chromosome partitioning ATPase
MKMLLEELKSEFDAIVIDSPPVMAASDALLLAPKADTVLFLVKWAQTNRKIVNESIRRIAEVDGDVGGVILTMVDPAKQEKYDFGDSGYYHSAVRKYYKV